MTTQFHLGFNVLKIDKIDGDIDLGDIVMLVT